MAKTISELVLDLVHLEIKIIKQSEQVQYFPMSDKQLREDEIAVLELQRDIIADELDKVVKI